MSRITEEQLVLPALYLMQCSPQGRISTTKLKEGLIEIFRPSGKDSELAKGRSDTYFSQKVRNLKSHDTLERLHFAIYEKKPGERSGYFVITQQGRDYLKKYFDEVEFLVNHPFASDDLQDVFLHIDTATEQKIVEIFNENDVVNEGRRFMAKTKVATRSKKLRDAAVEAFSVDGRIKCQVCCFDFEKFYGEIGKQFIEIHHIKPIFQFTGDDTVKTINQALKNVVAVCSNCHRMIHRQKKHPLSIAELKACIKEELSFCN